MGVTITWAISWSWICKRLDVVLLVCVFVCCSAIAQLFDGDVVLNRKHSKWEVSGQTGFRTNEVSRPTAFPDQWSFRTIEVSWLRGFRTNEVRYTGVFPVRLEESLQYISWHISVALMTPYSRNWQEDNVSLLLVIDRLSVCNYNQYSSTWFFKI